MKDFKQYIGEKFLGKTVHLTCECLIPFDVTGRVIDYSIEGNELTLHVDVNGKIMRFGENHPNLKIDERLKLE